MLDDLLLLRRKNAGGCVLGRHQVALLAGHEQGPAHRLRGGEEFCFLLCRGADGREAEDGPGFGKIGRGLEGLPIGSESRRRRRMAEMGGKGIAEAELPCGLGAGARGAEEPFGRQGDAAGADRHARIGVVRRKPVLVKGHQFGKVS